MLDWTTQSHFQLDEQLRRIRTQLEDVAWKLDSWYRGSSFTNKLRLEVRQLLEAQQNMTGSVIEPLKLEVSNVPNVAVTSSQTFVKDEKTINQTNHTEQTDTVHNQTEPIPLEQIENSSGDGSRLLIPYISGLDHANELKKELEVFYATEEGMELFKFFNRQPFRTVEIGGKSYVEAESVFVAVCLVVMDWMNSQYPERIKKLKEDFLNSDCSWINGNQTLPPEHASLTENICKRVVIEFILALSNQNASDILYQYDIGYVLEALIRQHLIIYSKKIPADHLKNFRVHLQQYEVLEELTQSGYLLDGIEVQKLEVGYSVRLIVGDSECRLLTDQGRSSCFIEV